MVVAGTTALGTVTTQSDANVSVTGVAATGNVGSVLVWGEIDDNQNPNWQDINRTQSPSWGNINSVQNPSWSGVTDTQTPSWSSINSAQTPTWDDIAA